ncbi:TPA: glycosyltransferase [Serratia fonticola]
MNRIAVIDPASYALPYDYFFLKSLSENFVIDFYCSNSRFNSEYLYKISELVNVNVISYNISNSNKLTGGVNYIRMLFDILKKKSLYQRINLQWSIVSSLDILFALLIRKKLVMTFHNAIPHDYNKNVYPPFKFIASIAKKIMFVSQYTRQAFIESYGTAFDAKSMVMNHGVMPITNNSYEIHKKCTESPKRIVFWGNVKPYKGLDFILESADKLFEAGYTIEVYGKFDSGLKSLCGELEKKGCTVRDTYLPIEEVHELLSENIILILPYKTASQSGVMYTALHYSTIFISTSVGETCQFLNASGLKDLTFDYGSLSQLMSSLKYVEENHKKINEALRNRRDEFNWRYSSEDIYFLFDD